MNVGSFNLIKEKLFQTIFCVLRKSFYTFKCMHLIPVIIQAQYGNTT